MQINSENNKNEVRILISRWPTIIFFLLSVFFTYVTVQTHQDDWLLKEKLAALFFCSLPFLLSIVFFMRIRKPLLTIDESGLYHSVSGLIPWHEISKLSVSIGYISYVQPIVVSLTFTPESSLANYKNSLRARLLGFYKSSTQIKLNISLTPGKGDRIKDLLLECHHSHTNKHRLNELISSSNIYPPMVRKSIRIAGILTLLFFIFSIAVMKLQSVN